MDQFLSPVVLYAACALGAVGIYLTLPKPTRTPGVLGAIVLAAAAGVLFLGLGLGEWDSLPNINFYVFGAIAIGSALRVITHPRPVYAALYFILTILSTCGLFFLLSAEVMAAVLVIIYAGAILITYMFVIMLATQAPTEDQEENLAEYDRYSREPGWAALVGFILLATLITMLGRGSAALSQPAAALAGVHPDAHLLVHLPERAEELLRERGLLGEEQEILRDGQGRIMLDAQARTVRIVDERGYELPPIGPDRWPADLAPHNVEALAFSFLGGHPGAIEIAGVILLMAMIGAVVLARKKVELDERAAREARERRLSAEGLA